MISVLILTRNEQRDLPGCLASVSWSDDIHIFDSHSTDDTVAIARAAGAQIHTRAFDDYATHRNAALATIPFKHPWVFLLDADERPTPNLSREMQQLALAAPPETAAFRVRRRDYLFDTWLKHAQISPFYIRLVRPERARYTRAINEVLEVEGIVADLSYPLDHYPFSKGIAHWIAKHNQYSTMEAELIAHNHGLQNPSLLSALRDPRLPHPPPPPEGHLLPPSRTTPPQVAVHGLRPRSRPRRPSRPDLRHPPIHLRILHRPQNQRTPPRRRLNHALLITQQIEVVIRDHSLSLARQFTQIHSLFDLLRSP
ncbi:MAG: glycosyltransferase family 2 protein [Edaphobacter sp.]